MKKTLILLIAVLFCFTASAQRRQPQYAIVEYSACNLRQSPDYESPLETQELMGTVVELIGEQGYWYKIKSPQPYEAWVTNQALYRVPANWVPVYEKAAKYIVTCHVGKIYSQPTRTAQPLGDIVMGDVIRQFQNHGKPVKSGSFSKVMLINGKVGWIPSSDVEEYDVWESSCGEKLVTGKTRQAIVDLAKEFFGIPYLWGGMTPKGFDCSGLVRLCYLMNGLKLPRNASDMVKLGTDVPLDSLKPADLLFFGRIEADGSEHVTHVGMYVGSGKFIHSSHSVRINSMNPDDKDCYENISRLLRAKRIVQ